jgi:hypothetical protein
MVNDEDRPRSGTLRLVFASDDGKTTAAEELPFSLLPLGADSYTVAMKTPHIAGSYSLQAIAMPADDKDHPTISQRNVVVQASAKASH